MSPGSKKQNVRSSPIRRVPGSLGYMSPPAAFPSDLMIFTVLPALWPNFNRRERGEHYFNYWVLKCLGQ